ncbi:MAG: topoisomerase DNA-binding C4 zinc finger domain-containing protein, partial [Candidatus Omnitrophica bacterium]|nr:topoisomerase DNA-binding C4 zinc finger domain-containing protein [Candidatus Omnitrophota bacterium]
FLEVLRPEDDDSMKLLPPLEQGEPVDLAQLDENQHFTKPPPRFTEASLVKVLEENGIGRPSTYAPTIGTIVGRNYVERQGGSLIPTELGFLVVDLLVKNFERLMDVDFTAQMEEELDRIEEGSAEWDKVLANFYQQFSKSLETAKEAIQPVRKIEEKTDEICELCQSPMVIKWGRRGKFISCSAFPKCRNAKSIATGVACPKCGTGQLVARRARSGRGRPFYGCTRYPECDYIGNRLPSPGGNPAGDPPGHE